jgi:predicted lipoprotein with Yx(FWY)xxD motif
MIKRRSTSTLLVAAAAILLIVVAAACGSSHTGSPTAARSTTPQTKAPPAPPTIAVANSGLGNILVDSQGRTVYMFGADSGTTSACTGACAAAWPPVQATGTPTAGSGANTALVGTNGTNQVTYNGHPLYTFSGDNQARDTNGEGRVAFGGTWSALSPAGDPISAPASPPPPPAPPTTQPAPPTTQPAPPPKPAPQDPRVPQNGGGDGDADNRGGPDDGDGGV